MSKAAKTTVPTSCSVSRIDVATAGRRGSEIEINSQPSTCDESASRTSQPVAARPGVRSSSPAGSPKTATPTADAAVASSSGPAGRRMTAFPAQEAGVGDPREDAEDDAERWVAAVRARADDAGDEDDARHDDGDGRKRTPARSLAEQEPRDDADEDDLRVAEHRCKAGADGLDRVVPEDEVHREEQAGDDRKPPRAPRPGSEPPILEHREEKQRRQGVEAAEERARRR